MSYSNNVLVIYIIAWALAFLYYWKKSKRIGVINFLLGLNLFYSIVSFFLYNNYYANGVFEPLKLGPFVYLFSMMLITVQPIAKYDSQCIGIQSPSLPLIELLSHLYVFFAIIIIPVIVPNISNGIALIALSSSGGDELYSAYRDQTIHEEVWSFINVFKIGFNLFSDIGVLVFFYYLTIPKRKKYLVILMAMAIVVSMLESLSNGLRTALTVKAMLLIASFFMFKRFLPKKTISKLKIAGYILIFIVAFFIIAINNSRFEGKTYESNYQLLNYTGQANLYFNNYCLDAGGIRYGDRTFNMFKKWLMFENVPNDFYETRNKYSGMKLDDSKFSTFVGDFALDFGPVGAAVLLIFFSILFMLLTRQSKGKFLLFHQLIIVFFVMQVYVQGGMYLFTFSFSNNLKIVYFIFFYFLFRVDYERQIKNSFVIEK